MNGRIEAGPETMVGGRQGDMEYNHHGDGCTRCHG